MLKIGLYEQNITPDGPVDLPGQFYKRVSTHVESPVCVEVFACEKDDEQLIIASVDATGIYGTMTDDIRARVAEKCDIPDVKKIIVNATHIHTAPGYIKSHAFPAVHKFLPENIKFKPATDNQDYMPEEEVREFLIEKISDGIAKAWNNRKPAYIASEFGRAVVGHSRRVCFNDGTAKMWGIADKATFSEMESGNDTGVELLYIFDEDKKPMGALVNVSCPAQVCEHKSFVSSDFWGKARQFIREELGEDFITVGLCGAAGCQCPRDMIRFVLPDTLDPNLVRDNKQKNRRTDPDMYDVEGAVEIGERIRDVVVRKLKTAKENMVNDVPLMHEVSKTALPLRRVTETDKLNAEENIKRYIERLGRDYYDAYDVAAMHVDAGILTRYALQDTTSLHYIELHVARLGDIAFATNPFELFLDYGNKIRARSEATQTFLIQLACGSSGYLPTEKAEKGGHYSAYVSSGYVGHEGGQLLVDTTLEKIKKQFS